MNELPAARNEGVVIQNFDSEILIYDLLTNKAFCLNEISGIVYRHCDGKTTLRDLKSSHNFTDDLIYLALEQLRRENLLEKDNDFVTPLTGLSRRAVIKKVGFASVVALPVVSSLIAPEAVTAQSFSCTCSAPSGSNGRPQGCSCASNADCCGVCIAQSMTCSATTTASLPTAARCCPGVG